MEPLIGRLIGMMHDTADFACVTVGASYGEGWGYMCGWCKDLLTARWRDRWSFSAIVVYLLSFGKTATSVAVVIGLLWVC